MKWERIKAKSGSWIWRPLPCNRAEASRFGLISAAVARVVSK